THDVGAHSFERVVLASRDLLHGRGVNDHVGAVGGADQPLLVPNVPDEVADVAVAHTLTQLGLLQLVAGENADDDVWPRGDGPVDEGVAERARPARDEDGGTREVHGSFSLPGPALPAPCG